MEDDTAGVRVAGEVFGDADGVGSLTATVAALLAIGVPVRADRGLRALVQPTRPAEMTRPAARNARREVLRCIGSV